MNYCKICGGTLIYTHYATHNLTKEEYEAKYGTDKVNVFKEFKMLPKREISEREKRDALRNLKKRAM